MIWKISDIFVFIFAISLAVNVMIVLFAICQPFLERRFHMRQLSRLLKFFIFYISIPMPVFIGYTLYTAILRCSYTIESSDISRVYIIKMKTIGTSTPMGDHFLLYVLLCLWIVGFVYKGIKDTVQIQQILHKLDHYSKPSEDRQFLGIMETEKERLGIRRPVKLLIHKMIPGPFMLGLFQARIFLPEMELSDPEAKLILEHELTHFKNGDYLYRRLMFFLCALYWFNPFIYKLADHFIGINEMACDEMVLQNVGKKERCMYAKLIAAMAGEDFLGNGAVGLTGFTANDLERRITNIMKKSIASKKLSLLFLSLGVAASCSISALAAANGTVILQNAVAEKVESLHSVEEALQEDTFVEYTSLLDNDNVQIRRLDMIPRNATWIDDEINGRERVVMKSVRLSASTEVIFYIKADHTNDKFRAGLIDSNQNVLYVTSDNGKIDHMFKISKTDDYEFFLEGTTIDKIHVSGSVTVVN